MIKRVYITIMVLILGISCGLAQVPQVQINNITAAAGAVTLNVNMTNFTQNVNSVSLEVNFDAAQLTYTGFTPVAGFAWLTGNNPAGTNKVLIGGFDLTGYQPNGLAFDLHFTYTGTAAANLTWNTAACNISYGFSSITNVSYVNGTVTPFQPPQNPVVQIDNVIVPPGVTDVPLQMLNFTQNINSFTLNISYNTTLLQYVGIVNPVAGIQAGTLAANPSGGVLSIIWTGPGFIPSGEVFKLRFNYVGGFDASLPFAPGNIITYGLVPVENVSYVLGSVSQSQAEGTVTIGSQTSPTPGIVNLPLMFNGAGYNDVATFQFSLNYDQSKLSFISLESPVVPISTSSPAPGVLNLSWFGLPQNWTNATVTGIKFNYTGVTPTDVEFQPGSFVGDQLAANISTDFVDGTVTPQVATATLDIGDVQAYPGQTVPVPVSAGSVGVVDMMELHITFDNTKLTYISYTAIQPVNWTSVTQSGNTLTFIYLGLLGNTVTVTDGALVNLNFMYNGGGTANVVFGSGCVITQPIAVPKNVTFIPGSVSLAPTNMQAVIPNVSGCTQNIAIVPITLTDVDPFGAFNFVIGIDGAALQFVSLQNINPQLGPNLTVVTAANQVTISWFGTTPVTINGNIFEMKFNYLGDSPVNFNPGTFIASLAVPQLPVAYTNGQVDCNIDYRVLTVNNLGNGGIVVKQGATVLVPDPGTTNQFSVIYGATLTLEATAGSGWVFSNWIGNVTNPNTATTTTAMTSDRTVDAKYYKIGDANGDGFVNVLDVVAMVAYINLENPQPFIFVAADVDHNGIINVLDIVGAVSIIMAGG